MSSSVEGKTQFQQLIIDLQNGKVEEKDFFPAFYTTEFYVAINKKEDQDQQDFDFVVYDSMQNPGTNTIVISDQASYLEKMGAKDILLIKGGFIVDALYPDTEISIAFTGGGLGMPVEMINWLKANVKKAPTQEAAES